MARILGLDIGGANIKAAYIEDKKLQVATKYFPIWNMSMNEKSGVLDEEFGFG